MNSNLLKVDDYFNLIKKIDKIDKRLDCLEILLTSKQEEHKPKRKWLDVPEVCLLLNVSKRTVQAYRDNRMLKSTKLVGKIYFKAADIEAILGKNYS
ncbi:MAG: helix-turn-helix domain-containing protein [Bacteroidetes bacterium]|nr:helix-turn-helix domain-containing protein [Bacteroidota bacterium]